MRNIFTPGARIVNVSSHLGHLSLINGEAKKSQHLRELFADQNLPEKTLDSMMTDFMRLAKQGEEGRAANLQTVMLIFKIRASFPTWKVLEWVRTRVHFKVIITAIPARVSCSRSWLIKWKVG